MTIRQFFDYYKELTRTGENSQDLTKYCVTFMTITPCTIAEVWKMEKGKIVLPIHSRTVIPH